jgi:hypothetical protein
VPSPYSAWVTVRPADTGRTPLSGRILLVGGVIAMTCVGGSLASHSWPATIATLVPSAVLLVLAIRRDPPAATERTPRLRRGVAMWSALVVAGLAWEAVAFVRQPDWGRADPVHPTLSTLLDPVLEHGPLRYVGWLLWLVAGWRLVTR